MAMKEQGSRGAAFDVAGQPNGGARHDKSVKQGVPLTPEARAQARMVQDGRPFSLGSEKKTREARFQHHLDANGLQNEIGQAVSSGEKGPAFPACNQVTK
jgi:hypothetical protein